MGIRVRPIDAALRSGAEIDLVAARMRETLIEVLGAERGAALYSMDWLRARVRWHLDAGESDGAVFVAEAPCGSVTGHTIVRVERGESGASFGLFSTTFVDPAFRRTAIASALLDRGESWMIERALPTASTCTASTNTKLIALYEKRGYRITAAHEDMVRLAKALSR